MNKSIFTQFKSTDNAPKVVSTDALFDTLSKVTNNKTFQVKANIAGLESIDPTKMNGEQKSSYDTFSELRGNLYTALADNFGGSVRAENIFGNEAISAAALALLAANGGKSVKEDFTTVAPTRGENTVVYRSQFGANEKYGAVAGNERFDEAKYSPYRASTAALQLAVLNQQEYIELAYPTLVLGPTEFGYTLKVPRGTIQDRAHTRNADGSPKDIRKTSIIAQYRQAGSTVEHANRLYPIKRDESKEYLVDYGTRNVTTFIGTNEVAAPIKVGKTCDYIRLTQPTGYTEFAPMAGTTSLAPGGRLTDLFLKFSDDDSDIVRLDIANRPGSVFVHDNTNGLEYNTGRMNFEASFKFDKNNIKNVDGATDSPALTKLVDSGKTVEIVINFNATIMLENGQLSTSSAKPYIKAIYDPRGIEIARDKWTDDQKDFATSNFAVDGVWFDNRRSNSNLEIFGDIVHVDTVQVHFESAINHPISVLATVGSEDSPEILAMVTQAVKLNKHRMATVALLDALRNIKSLCTGGPIDPIRVQGAPAGALCYLPAYAEDSLDISVGMNNEKSGEVLDDITGAIRAKLKQMVSKLMTESMYVQAVQAAYVVGQKQKQIKIALITSQFIADFLQLTGDPRLLGDEYEVEIQVNPSSAFDNKIVFFPTTIDNGKTEVSPLQFGLGLHVPDIIYQAVATYNNQTTREMRVMNRWTPHTLGVVMGSLDVAGISTVVTERVGKTVVVTQP